MSMIRYRALVKHCQDLEAQQEELNAQLDGELKEELEELQEACHSLRLSNQELAGKLSQAAAAAGTAGPATLGLPMLGAHDSHSPTTLEPENGNATAHREADSTLRGEVAALREAKTQLRAKLAVAAAKIDRLRKSVSELQEENLELSSQVAAHSCELDQAQQAAEAKLADMAEVWSLWRGTMHGLISTTWSLVALILLNALL